MRAKDIFTLYILRCADDSYYTGITRELSRRLAQHHKGEVVYTSTRLPVQLVYQERFSREEDAVKRERQIKSWTRRKKEALIRQQLQELPKLAKKDWRKE
jgi:putative endonuclease